MNTLYTCTSRWILVITGNVSGKTFEKIKRHFLCSVNFFSRKSCRVCDDMEKCDWVGEVTDDNIIQRMLFACWITKGRDTHSEHVILIVFPQQQWLRERAAVLFYTTIPPGTFTLIMKYSVSLHQWRTEGGFGVFKPPPPPRNSEDTGGDLDRTSKKNRRLDFLLQFTVFSYGCNLLNKGFF